MKRGTPSLSIGLIAGYHALIVDGRGPFARIAAVLGSSEQTVARRYRRLREAGVIRVRGLQGPADAMLDWFVRLTSVSNASVAWSG